MKRRATGCGIPCVLLILVCLTKTTLAGLPPAPPPPPQEFQTLQKMSQMQQQQQRGGGSGETTLMSPKPFTTSPIVKAKKDKKIRKKQKEPWERTDNLMNSVPTIDQLEHVVTDADIENVLDQILGSSGGPIIRRFKPEPLWLWRCWYGTVLYNSSKGAIINMIWSTVVCLTLGKIALQPGSDTSIRSILMALPTSDQNHPLLSHLKVLEKVWNLLTSFSTFLLTFFVGQAYGLWRDFYGIGRSIQGRLNDINLLVATHAARSPVTRKKGSHKRNPDDLPQYFNNSKHTPEALRLCEKVSSNLKAYHILMWASNARRFRMLLTNRGLHHMVQRGIISKEEKYTLDTLVELPKTMKHLVFLEWIAMDCQKGLREGTLIGNAGFEHLLLDKICMLRGTVGSIGDKLDGRMPLAYAHFVQILVDTLVYTAPFAQYGTLGPLGCILSVGILTIFYSGLLDLAKVFLDPLDNEDYCQGSVHMDIGVLIRESNAASKRWIHGASKY